MRKAPVKRERFRSEILLGHKGAAVEVPFDPSARWGIPVRPLWSGRRGHRVRGSMKGVKFESAIVPRSRRFWMLVEESLRRSAGVSIGETVEVTIEPFAASRSSRGGQRDPTPPARTGGARKKTSR